MKKTIALLAAGLLLVLLCQAPAVGASRYGNIYGTTKRLHDRTIIVSVFANDAKTTWNWEKRADYDLFVETFRRVEMAAEWIRKQAAASGVKTDLLWDFYNTPYLYAEATFTQDMQVLSGSVYQHYQDWIEQHGHMDFLKQHFEADSILYAFYYNSPKSSRIPSYSFPTTGRALSDYTNFPDHEYIEICVFFTQGFNITTVPAAYAHELLHCFGGVDMYRENPDFNMSQKFIKWFQSTHPKDLYAVTYHGAQNKVNYEMSDLTRYYLGLIPRPSEVEHWGLKKSDYDLFGY